MNFLPHIKSNELQTFKIGLGEGKVSFNKQVECEWVAGICHWITRSILDLFQYDVTELFYAKLIRFQYYLCIFDQLQHWITDKWLVMLTTFKAGFYSFCNVEICMLSFNPPLLTSSPLFDPKHPYCIDSSHPVTNLRIFCPTFVYR